MIDYYHARERKKFVLAMEVGLLLVFYANRMQMDKKF
jgi:hypothetical protein